MNVIYIDDDATNRAVLCDMIASAGLPITDAPDAKTGLKAIKDGEFDLVLMDLRMPVLGGVDATRRLLAEASEKMDTAPRVVVLTTFEEDEEIFAALQAGAVGYLLKACSAEKLCESVRAAAQGTAVLEPSVAARMMAGLNRPAALPGRRGPAAPLADPLSERELAVLRLLAEGCSNKEIGARLAIAEGTVKNHMTNVLGKLGVLDRTQAALKARELGYL